MYGPKYVWFFPHLSSGGWIFSDENFFEYRVGLSCNIRQILKAAEGFLTVHFADIRQDNQTTVSGLVSSDILS